MGRLLFGPEENRKVVAVSVALVVAAILVVVVGRALFSAAHQSTRPLSVTVMGATQEATNAYTHGATVCIGQYGSNPPSNQCAKTNNQGVAEVETASMTPGSYGVLAICPGQQRGYWVRNGVTPVLVAIPEQGDPAPVTVTGFDCLGS